jgi:hypothetical protein
MPGIRPFTRRQAQENAAFLDQLRRTGNARLAARALGAHRAKFTKRREKHAAFAAQWEMALAACHAAMTLGGGPRPPEGKSDALRTEGGEPTIVRLKSGRLQLRLAPPGRMTKAAEQAFFRALAASANVKLSAAATGFSYGSFYWRKRVRADFAREMRGAISIGCDRLELVLLESAYRLLGEGVEAHFYVDNPLPPMTVGQCIHLVTMHQNRDRLIARIDRTRRVPAPFEETRDGHRRRREAAARARHYETTGSWRFPDEPAPPLLPPLDQVTGWSKADPDRKPHNPDRPLFGGWRLDDWERKKTRKR